MVNDGVVTEISVDFHRTAVLWWSYHNFSVLCSLELTLHFRPLLKLNIKLCEAGTANLNPLPPAWKWWGTIFIRHTIIFQIIHRDQYASTETAAHISQHKGAAWEARASPVQVSSLYTLLVSSCRSERHLHRRAPDPWGQTHLRCAWIQGSTTWSHRSLEAWKEDQLFMPSGKSLEWEKHLDPSIISVDRLHLLGHASGWGTGVQRRRGEYKDGPEVKLICYTHWDTGNQGLELEAQY